MLIDGFGVGFGIHSDRTKEIIGDTKEISATTLGSVHALYGRSMGGVLNLYGKVEFRGGIDTYNYDSPAIPDETKHSDIGLNLEAGAPIALGNSGGLYFIPYLAYDYNVIKDDEYKDIYSGFTLGTRMSLSLPIESFAGDCDQVRDFSTNMYAQGVNVLGGYSQFNLNFVGARYLYNGTNGSDEYGSNSISSGLLLGEYYHYLFDNIAIGGELRLKSSGSRDKDTDDKQSSFSWMVKPKIMANLPLEGELNNAFAFTGFGFGTASDKADYFGSSYTTTENRTILFLGAGYNLFLAKGFSMVPTLNYTWFTSKDTETDDKSNRNGIETEVYFRYSF
ncbi:MAG: hypothetical protein U5L72_14820 [Bacteroidales bacterium]|nr:hypothetical protein [Bacteroidales bacterium]